MSPSERAKLEKRLAAAEVEVERRVSAAMVDALYNEYRTAEPPVQAAIDLALGRLKHASVTGDPAVAAAVEEHGTAAVALAEIARVVPEIAARVAAKVGVTIGRL